MDKTLRLLTKSLKHDPEDWETRKHLIDCYVENSDVASAVNLVREAPNMPQEDEDLLGVVNFLGSHDPFAALGFAERAVMEDQNRGASHLAKAIACDYIGQPDAAAQHKAQALQLNPGLSTFLDEGESEVGVPVPTEIPAEAAAEATPVIEEAPVYEEPIGITMEEPEELQIAELEGPEMTEPVKEIETVQAAPATPVPITPANSLAPPAPVYSPAAELPPIQPLVDPEDVPAPVEIHVDEVEATPLDFTADEDLEQTRSHLLVADPAGEFHDADEYEEIHEYDEHGEIVVAPAGIIPHAAEADPTKAKVSAILMTIAVHAILFALIGLVIIAAPRLLPPEIVAATVPVSESQTISKKQVVQQSPPKQVSPPAPSISAITSMASTSAATIPNVDFEADTSMDLGTSFGASMNFGSMGGDMGAGVPFTMKSRCSATERQKLLREHGGSTRVARAVKKSLDFLATQQNEDGSWGDTNTGAMTGFALLSFLGHCETPDSPTYGDVVMKGIMFLVELGEKNDGILVAVRDGHYPYAHGIATYALGETYALAKYGKRQLPGVREAFEKGVQIIVAGQTDPGGWKYSYGTGGGGDTSVTGWQYQALKAAKHTNLKIGGLKTAISRAEGYFKTVKDPGGFYKYNANRALNSKSNWNMTGVCVLGMQLLGDRKEGEHEKEIDEGIEWMLANAEANGFDKYDSADPYGWYYATQVMFQKGGDPWKKWNKIFAGDMLDKQENDGSWKPEGRPGHAGKGPKDKVIYYQCLNTLMLEVYFRYLPAAG